MRAGPRAPDDGPEPAHLEREMLGTAAPPPDPTEQVRFEIDSALQGREGVEAARRARGDGRPYKIAFVDIRMPPSRTPAPGSQPGEGSRSPAR